MTMYINAGAPAPRAYPSALEQPAVIDSSQQSEPPPCQVASLAQAATVCAPFVETALGAAFTAATAPAWLGPVLIGAGVLGLSYGVYTRWTSGGERADDTQRPSGERMQSGAVIPADPQKPAPQLAPLPAYGTAHPEALNTNRGGFSAAELRPPQLPGMRTALPPLSVPYSSATEWRPPMNFMFEPEPPQNRAFDHAGTLVFPESDIESLYYVIPTGIEQESGTIRFKPLGTGLAIGMKGRGQLTAEQAAAIEAALPTRPGQPGGATIDPSRRHFHIDFYPDGRFETQIADVINLLQRMGLITAESAHTTLDVLAQAFRRP